MYGLYKRANPYNTHLRSQQYSFTEPINQNGVNSNVIQATRVHNNRNKIFKSNSFIFICLLGILNLLWIINMFGFNCISTYFQGIFIILNIFQSILFAVYFGLRNEQIFDRIKKSKLYRMIKKHSIYPITPIDITDPSITTKTDQRNFVRNSVTKENVLKSIETSGHYNNSSTRFQFIVFLFVDSRNSLHFEKCLQPKNPL